MMADAPQPWVRAMRAMAALAVDPGALKGLTLRARAGPVRQTAEAALSKLPGRHQRIHPGLTDTQLFGGLNISASLSEGRLVQDKGLADRPATLILPMAERCPPGLAIRLGQLLDAGLGHTLILLDEGAEPEEEGPQRYKTALPFTSISTGCIGPRSPCVYPRRQTSRRRAAASCGSPYPMVQSKA